MTTKWAAINANPVAKPLPLPLPLPVPSLPPAVSACASAQPSSLAAHPHNCSRSTDHTTEPSSSDVASTSGSTPPTSIPDTSGSDSDPPRRGKTDPTHPPTTTEALVEMAHDAIQDVLHGPGESVQRDGSDLEKVSRLDLLPTHGPGQDLACELKPSPEREIGRPCQDHHQGHHHQDDQPDEKPQPRIAQNVSDAVFSAESSPSARHSSEPSPNTRDSGSLSLRPRRNRGVATYNLSKLFGTDVHGKRASKGDDVDARRRERRSRPSLRKHDVYTEFAESGVVYPGAFTCESPARARSTRASTSTLPPDVPGSDDDDSPLVPRKGNPTSNTPQKSAKIAKPAHGEGDKDRLAASSSAVKAATRKKHASESLEHRPRYGTRNSGIEAETLATKLGSLNKKRRSEFEKSHSIMSRELRRLQDTNEFAHIETKPVLVTFWSNGKEVRLDPVTGEPEKKKKEEEKAKRQEEEEEEEEEGGEESAEKEGEDEMGGRAPSAVKKPRAKKWLDRGVYAGQNDWNATLGLTAQERKKWPGIQELIGANMWNSFFRTPIFAGLRLLVEGRDFRLPFDICNPLPPGHPRPDQWKQITKSEWESRQKIAGAERHGLTNDDLFTDRFVGDAAAIWKKTPHFTDSSTCVCTPEDGCAEDCQNRIMLYECDDKNCNVGREHCSNRAFQDLQDRVKGGGKYRIGVEVFKTDDRGYGVRSNRCFEHGQIIMEYTGEIITEDECERRMKEEYKNNECYYLMSFDQNMIIDATTGSIARFVNHSCAPNCRMIKWIVSGQPRMALFAGDRPIMTGDELTYDYNFDPFSAKNVQKCLCGSENCRGVLGPKTTKPNSNSVAAKMAAAAGKDKSFGKGFKAAVKPVKPVKPIKPGKPARAAAAKDFRSKVRAAEVKATKDSLKQARPTGTNRKLKDVFMPVAEEGDDEDEYYYAPPKKKRKVKVPPCGAAKKTGLSAAKRAALPDTASSSKSATPKTTNKPTCKLTSRKYSARVSAKPSSKLDCEAKPDVKGESRPAARKSTDSNFRDDRSTGRTMGKKRRSPGNMNAAANSKQEEPRSRPAAFRAAQFSVASPTPDLEPVPVVEATRGVEPLVERVKPLPTPQPSESAPPAASPSTRWRSTSSCGLASGGTARVAKTLPKIIPINRNRGGDIESSTTASSVDEVPPSSSTAAAAARAKASQSNGTALAGERTPVRKRRRVQIPKAPLLACRDPFLATGGPAFKSPTSSGTHVPVTIPSANGATLVEGKDFVRAFDDDDDLMDLDGPFSDEYMGSRPIRRNSFYEFESPGRGGMGKP